MKKQDFENWAISKGWTLDRWGHLQKERNGRQYRFKLSKVAVRHEVKCLHPADKYSPASTSWIRLASGYFSGLKILITGQVIGFKR